MGTTKRLLELTELSEELTERYHEDGISLALVRHQLRSLPWQYRDTLEPFGGILNPDEDFEDLLIAFRSAIVSVCHSVLLDEDVEALFEEQQSIPQLLLNLNALSYGQTELHEDLSGEYYEGELTSSVFPPLYMNTSLSKDGRNTSSGTFAAAVFKFLDSLGSSKAWAFWREWYQGFLDGKPLDWELQRRVALIDDAIWAAGPEVVADEIERIKAEYLAEKAPQAERVEFNPETAKFFTVPIKLAKPDLLGATLTQVEDALDDALANLSNGLHEQSREVRVLRRVFTNYGNDPQQIEMSFVSVHAGLTRQILKDELPPSEENLALQSAVEEGARGIRATHPEVAENRKILSEQKIRELPEGAKEKLEEALPILRAISESDLAEDWDHDIPTLINDATRPLPSGAPALPGADEATRIFSRAAKISLHLKAADIVHKIDGSAGYKAARIITTVGALVSIGLLIF